VAFELGIASGGQGKFGKVIDNKNGTYTATFTGTIAGKNTIVATIGGSKVTSTQAVTVTPGFFSLAKSVVSVAALGRVAENNPITVTLQTKDAAGNNLATDLLTEGVSISLELGSSTGGKGNFSSVVYVGNGEYSSTFSATAMGSNTVLALIGNSKVTSRAPTIVVT
jgi:hypothetical protein